jgi:hypothetical protein
LLRPYHALVADEYTALELAEEYERKTIIALLKQAGAR